MPSRSTAVPSSATRLSTGKIPYSEYFFPISQCCESGMFIPDAGSEFFPFRILDPNFPSRIRIFSIPDPHQKIKYFNPKKLLLSSWKYDPGRSSRIRILIFTHPGSRIQGTKRHRFPDPGSGSATMLTLFFTRVMLWTLLLLLSGCPWLWPSSSRSWPSSWSTSSHPMIPGKFTFLTYSAQKCLLKERFGWSVPSQII